MGNGAFDVRPPAPKSSSLVFKKRLMNAPGNLPIVGVPIASDPLCRIINTAYAPTQIRYGNGVYIAIISGNVYRSFDAITWTATNSGNSITWLFFINGIFVAMPQSGTTVRTFYTSPDGATWTSRTQNFGAFATDPDIQLFGLTNGKVYITSGNNPAYWYTSTDGITYTASQPPLNWVNGTGTPTFLNIEYANGQYVFLARYYDPTDFGSTPYIYAIWTSPDGVSNWTVRKYDTYATGGAYSLFQINGLLICENHYYTTHNIQKLFHSFDGGVTWVNGVWPEEPLRPYITANSTSYYFNFIKINGAIVAFFPFNTSANTQVPCVYRSTDGLTWFNTKFGVYTESSYFSPASILYDNPLNLQMISLSGGSKLVAMNPYEIVAEKQ